MTAELTNPISGKNIIDRFNQYVADTANSMGPLIIRYGRDFLPRVSGHLLPSPGTTQTFVPQNFFGGPTAGTTTSVGGVDYKKGERINATQLANILCQELIRFMQIRRVRFRYVVTGTGGNIGSKNPNAAASGRFETIFVDDTAFSYISKTFSLIADPGEGATQVFFKGQNYTNTAPPFANVVPFQPTALNGVGTFEEVPSPSGIVTFRVGYSPTFSGGTPAGTAGSPVAGFEPIRPTNMVSGKLINETDIELFFARIVNTFRNVSSETVVPIFTRTVCHASCHSSCHGSRGRR